MFSRWVPTVVARLVWRPITLRRRLGGRSIHRGAASGAVVDRSVLRPGMNFWPRHLPSTVDGIITRGAWRGHLGVARCYDGRAAFRARIGIGRLRPFRVRGGGDGAWSHRLFIAGVRAGGTRDVDTVAVDRFVAVGVRLARSFGGGTVLRALAAAATRGTSTFVHAAKLSKGEMLRLLAQRWG